MTDKFVPVFFDIETTGFNPMAQEWYNNVQYGARVTAVAIGTIDKLKQTTDHTDLSYDCDCYWDDSEYRLLNIVHDRMNDVVDSVRNDGDEPYLVTFNGRQYDHPYIGARFSRLRLDGYPFTHGVKRLDMMRALGKHLDGVRRYPSEDDCLEAMGIESDDPYDGSDMPDAYGDREWHKIEEHATKDVEEMMRLFVATQEECLTEFYDHYDIEADASITETIDF